MPDGSVVVHEYLGSLRAMIHLHRWKEHDHLTDLDGRSVQLISHFMILYLSVFLEQVFQIESFWALDKIWPILGTPSLKPYSLSK